MLLTSCQKPVPSLLLGTVMTLLSADQSLSTLMREGSAQEHQAAEDSSFMSELLAGRVNEQGYADYLTRLHRVYVALEEVGHGLAGDPVAAAVLDAALERRAAIETDLAHWSSYASADTASPAADAYAERVRQAASWGGLFVAHHYTRYLGDLSGGQAIGRILARTFELADGTGVAFYDFTEIPKPKPYKDAYRARLDALDLTPEEKERVLDEVRVAFGLNSALFAELGDRLGDYRR
jgi:heme oxygenase (biliverdin-producing, ferredoxin)